MQIRDPKMKSAFMMSDDELYAELSEGRRLSSLTPKNCDTSISVLSAIKTLALGDDAVGWRIWETPNPAEIEAIIAILESSGAQYPEDYYWGEDGARWAIGAKGSDFYERNV